MKYTLAWADAMYCVPTITGYLPDKMWKDKYWGLRPGIMVQPPIYVCDAF